MIKSANPNLKCIDNKIGFYSYFNLNPNFRLTQLVSIFTLLTCYFGLRSKAKYFNKILN